MPSIHKLTLVYINYRAVKLRVLEVQPLIVHTHSHDVVPSIVVLFVRTGIGWRLEDLDEDDHWLAKKKVLLEFSQSHTFLTGETDNVLEVSARAR